MLSGWPDLGPACQCVLAGAADRLRVGGGRKRIRVTAQPTEDPADPLVILETSPNESTRSSSGSTTGRWMPRTTRPVTSNCGAFSMCGA